jgi:hypothetical protein
MAGDELLRGITIAVFAPALRQHESFLRLQQGKALDLIEISIETGLV